MTSAELVALYLPADSIPPIAALDRLDHIDWAAVSHAYGPATDLPALLRALASPVEEHRSFGLQDLFQTVWHQGTVYSATATVVPFLFDLLEADGPQDKPAIADLLATIAGGRPPYARCENAPEAAAEWRAILEKSGLSLDAEMEQGRAYHADIKRQILTRFDELYPYIRNPRPEARYAIATAVGQFPEVAKRLLPDLSALLEIEQEEYVCHALQEAIDRAQMTP